MITSRASVETARAMATSCCTARLCRCSGRRTSMSSPKRPTASRAVRWAAGQSIMPKRVGSRPSTMFSVTS